MQQIQRQQQEILAALLEYQQNQRTRKYQQRIGRLREIKLVLLSAGFGLMLGQCQFSGAAVDHLAHLFDFSGQSSAAHSTGR
jgi:hypothetical protein